MRSLNVAQRRNYGVRSQDGTHYSVLIIKIHTRLRVENCIKTPFYPMKNTSINLKLKAFERGLLLTHLCHNGTEKNMGASAYFKLDRKVTLNDMC